MFKFILVAALVACASADGGASDDAHAQVLAQTSKVSSDGFESVLDISNNIHQKAHGDAHGNIEGAIDWISPEGVNVDIVYTADENGYHPSGALLPTAPPTPEAILKSLAYNAAHPHKEESHK